MGIRNKSVDLAQMSSWVEFDKRSFKGSGSTSSSWEKVHECWALIETSSSSEQYVEGGIQHVTSHTVTIRAGEGDGNAIFSGINSLLNGVRMRYDGREFKVLGATTDESFKQFFTLDVTEGVAT